RPCRRRRALGRSLGQGLERLCRLSRQAPYRRGRCRSPRRLCDGRVLGADQGARGRQPDPRSRRVLYPRIERGGAGAAGLRRRDGAVRSPGRRISCALCRLLRSRLRLCRRRRRGGARGAGGALARGAVHPRARPDRRPPRLREDAVAAERHVRPAHRLELPGAGAEAVKTLSAVTVIARSEATKQSSSRAWLWIASLALAMTGRQKMEVYMDERSQAALWTTWRSVAELYHAYFTGLTLTVVTRRGTHEAAEFMFRVFRRQQQERFLPGLKKLGLDHLPPAVAAAQYHYLSNWIGGVHVEYMYESDRKAWIRYPPPRWAWKGTAICGIPPEVSKAML